MRVPAISLVAGGAGEELRVVEAQRVGARQAQQRGVEREHIGVRQPARQKSRGGQDEGLGETEGWGDARLHEERCVAAGEVPARHPAG